MGLLSRFCVAALDLGTANTLIHVQGRGLVVNQASMVTLRESNGSVEAVGQEARSVVGRTPPSLRIARPILRGTIADLNVCGSMLRHFIAKARENLLFPRLHIAVAVPGHSTAVERLAVIESLRDADVTSILLIDNVLAAAYGGSMDVDEPRGRMIADFGAGVSEAAVLSLSGVVCSRSLAIGGDEMDAAIADYIQNRYHLLIGNRMAEEIKIRVGSALPLPEPLKITAKGRCLVQGIPRDVTVEDGEIRDALAGPVSHIVRLTRETLEQAPPELSADIVETGIVLTGGTALLRNLDRRIEEECGVPVMVDPNPLESVVTGLARMSKNLRRNHWRRFGNTV